MIVPVCRVFTLVVQSFFVSMSLYAQDDFEDLVKQQDDIFNRLREDAEQRYQEIQKVDAEFAEILNRAWKELELSTGIDPDPTPKPDSIPMARPGKEPKPSAPPEETKDTEIVPEQPSIEISPVTTPDSTGLPLSVDFYHTGLNFFYDKGMIVSLGDTVSEHSISIFWENLGKTVYAPLVEQLLGIRDKLGLNDWGYCILVNKVAHGITGNRSNDRLLLTWFLLVKSGYNTRVGFTDGRVYLLIPSLNIVYGTPYYVMEDKHFFLTGLGETIDNIRSLFTYEGNHQDARKLIDFTLETSPVISRNMFSKAFHFSYGETDFNLQIPVNKNIIEFFDSYPQTNLDVYFDAAFSPESSQPLLESLKPLVSGRAETEAVNILLRFVQSAFAYKTDDSQFGKEKYLFSEETLFYPFSDCEDRSILFAHLVKNLLGLEVIGLDYPGHIATAVKFTSEVKGDAVTHNNIIYIICDPTYLYADYGECMPKFKDVTPGIITLN